jgi:phosphoribosyl-ATP pyrophosphohydrolase
MAKATKAGTKTPGKGKASSKAKVPKQALPVPEGVPAAGKGPRKAVLAAERAHEAPFAPPEDGDARVLDRLWATIEQRRQAGDVTASHSARLMARGTPKVAQKLGEEAVELVIEAVARNHDAIVSESADVLYHLMVLLVDAGIRPDEIWAELRRREGVSGIVEKAARPRPKALLAIAQTTKLP